jgi:formiminoglutamase
MFSFLQPIQLQHIIGDNSFKEGQYGKVMDIYTDQEPDWQLADVIIVSINEERGKGLVQNIDNAYAIRKQLYSLYCWHNEIKICDLGVVVNGNSLQDSYAALQIVLGELLAANKTVIIIGNSHDITLAQYGVYQKDKQFIEATCIDAKIDLSLNTPFREENFLMEMLTGEPNYIKHYNHLGFQSYFVHPTMMDTLESLRFDCHRVGKVREHISEYEPVLRNSNMVSIDVNALQHSVMPCNTISPNGFAGDEACILTKYAGMSTTLSTLGIYNYNAHNDKDEIGASQIAQMIWYFIDGKYQLQKEKSIVEKEQYNEYHTAFGDVQISFLQNKITHRWWMKVKENEYIACSSNDYVLATHNEIPERWLRLQERLVL